MPIFQANARSWETYLAGFGASGALLASAFVMFAILVGLVTFNAWPHPGALFRDGGDVAVKNASTSSPAQPTTLNLTQLLGGGAASATRHRGANRGNAPNGNDVLTGGTGGSTGVPGGSGGGQSPVGSPQPQPPSPPSQPRSLVGQVVSDAGNTVQGTTDTLGNALGGSSSPGLGGVVGGVGRTLNNTLQSLAGNH
jgi:hypothetical protein